MNRRAILAIVGLVVLGLAFGFRYASPGLFKGQFQFADLNNAQKQQYWEYMKACQSFLKDKNYAQYRSCALGAFDKAAKSSVAQAWCNDSDGVDYFTKGNVVTNIHPEGIVDYAYTYGSGKSYLMEGACNGSAYVYYQKNCSELGDYVAADGACRKPSFFDVTVSDQDGKVVVGADVSAYKAMSYVDIKTMDPVLTGVTDVNGNAKFNITAIPNETLTLVSHKKNYVGAFADNIWTDNHKDITQQMIITLSPTPDSISGSDISKTSFKKLMIDSKEAIGPLIANEQWQYIYAMVFAPDVIGNIAKVDAHMVVHNNDLDATKILYEFTKKNINWNDPQSFSLSLPSGVYGYYLYFDITYKNGDSEMYPLPYKNAVYYFDQGYVKLGFAYNFIVLPEINYSTCEPFKNSQNGNDPNTVNVLFINIGEEPSTFKAIAQEFVNGDFGLLSQEPFSSNKKAFQFWLAEKSIVSIDDLTSKQTDTYNLIQQNSSNKKPMDLGALSNTAKIKLSCHLSNRQIVYIKNAPDLWGVKCVDGYTSIYDGSDALNTCMQTNSKKDCIEKIPYDTVFDHEFGHEFASLVEEYTSDNLYIPSKDISKVGYLQAQNPFKNYGSYYSPFIDPSKDCVRQYGGTGNYICEGDDKTIKDCKNNARWKDLLGKGCGSNGSIDCDKANPDQGLEVTCENFGGGTKEFASLMKPSRVGLMGSVNNFTSVASNQLLFDKSCNLGGDTVACDTTIKSKNHLYGLVNERQICKFLKIYTGSAGGICNGF